MRDFWISDSHFYHDNIIKHCNRPFPNREVMNAEMIRRWNSVVLPDDRVYFGGDFSFGITKFRLDQLLRDLNGYKVMVRGNHDMRLSKSQWVARGFKECHESMRLTVGGMKILFVHRPVKIADIPQGIDYVICGHIHNAYPAPPRNLNISVEQIDYTPIPTSEVVSRLRWVRFDYKTGPQRPTLFDVMREG